MYEKEIVFNNYQNHPVHNEFRISKYFPTSPFTTIEMKFYIQLYVQKLRKRIL